MEYFKINGNIDKIKELFNPNEKYKGKVILEQLDKLYQRQYIRNWDDLSKLPTSNKGYKLKVDNGCASVHKDDDEEFYDYFSTHTFYGSTYKQSSKRLQDYDWDVELANCMFSQFECDYDNDYSLFQSSEQAIRQDEREKIINIIKEEKQKHLDYDNKIKNYTKNGSECFILEYYYKQSKRNNE